MSLTTLYESANKKMYETLTQLKGIHGLEGLSDGALVNQALQGMLNRIGESIVVKRASALKYGTFQRPVSEYGAITEYIGTKLLKPIDMLEPTQGQVIEEYVVNKPDFKVGYVTDRVKATYTVTTDDQRWKDAIETTNIGRLAQLSAMAVQSLYDSVTEHMNELVPVAFGAFYGKVGANSKVSIPRYEGDATQYAIQLNAIFRSAIRKLGYTSSKYNLLGADINSKPQDLVLVAFDSPIEDSQTPIDIITAQINFGAMSRATALQQSLGVAEVYEMESLGLATGSVAQSYATTGLVGMQITDMRNNVLTAPFPKVKFALVSKDALNVGAKSIRSRSTHSARADVEIHYVHMDLEVAFGAGNVIFFIEEDAPTPPETEE